MTWPLAWKLKKHITTSTLRIMTLTPHRAPLQPQHTDLPPQKSTATTEDGTKAYSANNTRPLIIVNCDNHIVASAART